MAHLSAAREHDYAVGFAEREPRMGTGVVACASPLVGMGHPTPHTHVLHACISTFTVQAGEARKNQEQPVLLEQRSRARTRCMESDCI